MELLSGINSPVDLRGLDAAKLSQLADELRDFMIDTVSSCGGHLAPSLGAVELAIALHYVFDTPTDKLLWDVGHQAYAHKILTGRRDRFQTLRQYGGISGFPRVGESEYDVLSVGHASTSISAGLGMAIARDLRNEKHKVVVVIGDGAMSGGLALEGLNNLGSHATDMIVVLNDNEMSISRNVGALSRYLTRVISDRRYNRLKTEIWTRLGQSTVGKSIRGVVQAFDDAVKHVVIPGKLFEDMGLRYFGPVDGHNITEMVEVFKSIRDSTRGPVLVHVQTKKGKGYSFAENDATKFHGVSSFSRSTGAPVRKGASAPTYSAVFGQSLVEMGTADPSVVAITAAMPDGTKLSLFRDAFPERFYDVGIAEGHAVTFAAGLAAGGLKPVVALYSTFLQRAYDQIVHDVALDNLHVVFGIDRAGLVGDDGPTHHGVFDIALLRTIPSATLMAPRNENELRNMLHTALFHMSGPVFIRYPRGSGQGVPIDAEPRRLTGEPEVLERGSGVALVAVGDFCAPARHVRDSLQSSGYSVTLVNARFVKPLDERFYHQLLEEHSHVVTLEPGTLAGGFGSALLESAAAAPRKKRPRILRIGYPDTFIGHGTVQQLLEELQLDGPGLKRRIREFLES